MQIRVDTASSVPVFQQIVDEVKSAIARGAVRPGEALPSVREMAAHVVVNPNTVAKAYRDLERDGILFTRKGIGVFVAEGAEKLSRSDRREEVIARLRVAIAEAKRAGVTGPELRAITDAALREEFSARKAAGEGGIDHQVTKAPRTDERR